MGKHRAPFLNNDVVHIIENNKEPEQKLWIAVLAKAFDDAFIFYDFEKVDENIMDTASKMNLDENSMALLKNTMNINRIDSELGKAESFLKMEQIGLPEGNLIGRDPSDLTDQQNTVASYKRYISDKQEQLNDEIGVYRSNVGKLFNKDPNTLDDYELYKGFVNGIYLI